MLGAATLIVAVASTSAFGTVRDLVFGARRSAAWAGAPTWSPDGRRIAFTTVACAQWCNGPVEINVMNADGSGQRNLSREWGLEGVKLFPRWSPNWRKIVFSRDRGVWQTSRGGFEVPHSDIYVMNVDGSGLRRLTRSPARDEPIAWSPDGREIVFQRTHMGGSDVYVVNADGSGRHRLARGVTFVRDLHRPHPESPAPAWSPNGRTIAFVSNRGGNEDIFVVNADGSGLRNLTRSRGNDRKPVWSPDGGEIAFRSDRDGNDEIYVIDADGSGLRRLTRHTKSDGGAVWSPDGRKILFGRTGYDGSADSNVNGDVYVMNADGSGQRNLTRSVTRPFATDRAPAWSPDGRKILFVSNRDGNGEVYVMNADGSGKRNLTQLKGRE